MSWFGGNKKSLCEELHANSTKTVESRQKAVDGLYNSVRSAVIDELRAFSKKNEEKYLIIKLDDLFAEKHNNGLIIAFRKAIGEISPDYPVEAELGSYGEKLVEDLKKEGLEVAYETDMDNCEVITIDWEVVPKKPEEKTEETEEE